MCPAVCSPSLQLHKSKKEAHTLESVRPKIGPSACVSHSRRVFYRLSKENAKNGLIWPNRWQMQKAWRQRKIFRHAFRHHSRPVALGAEQRPGFAKCMTFALLAQSQRRQFPQVCKRWQRRTHTQNTRHTQAGRLDLPAASAQRHTAGGVERGGRGKVGGIPQKLRPSHPLRGGNFAKSVIK